MPSEPTENLIDYAQVIDYFNNLQSWTRSNFYSKDTLSALDGPKIASQDDDYFYDAFGNKLAYKGAAYWTSKEKRFEDAEITSDIATEQFARLGRMGVLYVASLMRFYRDHYGAAIPGCVSPPPSPDPVSIGYLPSFFGGSIFTNKACAIKGVPSTIVIGGDGAIFGTECYQALSLPKNSPYSFVQDAGSIENTLNIFSLGSSPGLTLVNTSNSPLEAISVGGASPFSQLKISMKISALERLKAAVNFVARQKCQAVIRGAILPGDSYVDADAAGVSIRQGGSILASASYSDLVNLQASESFGFATSRTDWHFEASEPATMPGLTQVSVNLIDRDKSDLFEFSASLMKLGDGSSASAACLARAP